MNLEFTATELEFQQTIREWMQANVTPSKKPGALGHGAREDQMAWEQQLASQGWLANGWPTEHGGPGWDATQRHIFDEERTAAGGAGTSPFGLTMLAPVLMAFGNDAQKKRFLPRIADGTELWCQGYSEPGAGSDLAALKTSAVREGDEYVVNGQKIWTTYGHWANWIFCLVRTNAEGRKQSGISFLLIDMETPGIEVRAINTIDGEHHLNEVFFTDCRVPVENLVGQEGEGWTIAKYLLSHERTGIAGVAESKAGIESLKKMLAETETPDGNLLDDAVARRRIAELETDLMALEYTNFRTLDKMAKGEPPGAESSGLKIKGTELQQAISEAKMEFGGNDGLPWHTEEPIGEFKFNDASRSYNFLRASTIYGGSNEIQKNVIAKFLVAMPGQ